jgi:MFS superfamily sulfate permease-like transporter
MNTLKSAEQPRFGPNEWLGAVGDMGVFIPLFLGLVSLRGLPPAPTLLVFGAVYIGAAFYFRIPMPVQPLKTMAAVAITTGAGLPVLRAAGFWMGGILLVLALTGTIARLQKLFSDTIIKGIQFGVGLLLIRVGVKLLFSSTQVTQWVPLDSLTDLPSTADFLTALWVFVLPQIPLTLGNSVYAPIDLAKKYFGSRASRATSTRLAVSLGCSNLVAGLFGAFPLCHGSGGLTAHFRFGARTSGATLISGIIYLSTGFAALGTGEQFFALVPPWILGLMLLYVGMYHAFLLTDLKRSPVTAFFMGMVGLATGHLGYALAFGLLTEATVWGQRVPVDHSPK